MSQVDSTGESGALFSRALPDLEYNGELNRATQQGAMFALLLSMLEQNILFRPHIAPDQEPELTAEIASLSHYRSIPLAANSSYWQEVEQTEHFIQGGDLQNAKLWLAMHPEPLSLFNDAKKIPSEVLENCALSVRQRATTTTMAELPQDPPGLYDILQDLNQSHPHQASA